MTINQLIKKLERFKAKGHGRAKVCANAQSLLDQSNGVFQIADIETMSVDCVRQCDGDGFTIENKDGSERSTTCLVMK